MRDTGGSKLKAFSSCLHRSAGCSLICDIARVLLGIALRAARVLIRALGHLAFPRERFLPLRAAYGDEKHASSGKRSPFCYVLLLL